MIILINIYFSIIYLSIILTLNLAPLIFNEFITTSNIDRLLISKKKWPKSFILNLTIKDII